MYTFEEIVAYHNRVAEKHWPDSSALACATQAMKESKELLTAEYNNEPKKDKEAEAADVILSVLSYCRKAGISGEDLLLAMQVKIGINDNRKWKKNGDGTYSHIKEQL